MTCRPLYSYQRPFAPNQRKREQELVGVGGRLRRGSPTAAFSHRRVGSVASEGRTLSKVPLTPRFACTLPLHHVLYRGVWAGGITRRLGRGVPRGGGAQVASPRRRQRRRLCQRGSETVVGEWVGSQEDCNQNSMLKQAATEAMVPRTAFEGAEVCPTGEIS